MNKSNRIITRTLKMMTSLVLAFSLLSVISLFYKHTSPHVSPFANETYFRWEAGSFTSTMEEGFAWNKMDSTTYSALIPLIS